MLLIHWWENSMILWQRSVIRVLMMHVRWKSIWEEMPSILHHTKVEKRPPMALFHMRPMIRTCFVSMTPWKRSVQVVSRIDILSITTFMLKIWKETTSEKPVNWIEWHLRDMRSNNGEAMISLMARAMVLEPKKSTCMKLFPRKDWHHGKRQLWDLRVITNSLNFLHTPLEKSRLFVLPSLKNPVALLNFANQHLQRRFEVSPALNVHISHDVRQWDRVRKDYLHQHHQSFRALLVVQPILGPKLEYMNSAKRVLHFASFTLTPNPKFYNEVFSFRLWPFMNAVRTMTWQLLQLLQLHQHRWDLQPWPALSKDSSLAECRCNKRHDSTMKSVKSWSIWSRASMFSHVQPLTSVLQFVASPCVVISPWFHPATFAHNRPLKRIHCLIRLKDLEPFLVRDGSWWKGNYLRVVWLQFRLKHEIDSWLSSHCRRLLPSVHGAETTSAAPHGRGRCHLWTSSFVEFKEVNLVSTRITHTDCISFGFFQSHLANCVCGYLNLFKL